MSLLQHPLRALEQVEWYLNNKEQEQFPGAFLLAAGNLSRQVLEQIIFIVAFYSGLPRNRYLKSSNEIRSAGHILNELKKVEPTSGLSYFKLARRRGQRIRKFARFPRSLDKWRRLLNEPSHFSNPAAGIKTKEKNIHEFVTRFTATFEEIDGYLITAAVNELRSSGTIRAILAKDDNNTPGVQCDVVVTPNNLELENGKLSLKTRPIPIQVVPNSENVPYRWRRRVVVVQHSHGMKLGLRLITRTGHPINLTNTGTIIESFMIDSRDQRLLFRRLKQQGINVEIMK